MAFKEDVEKVLAEVVNPALSAHGGGVELVDVSDEEGKVKVRLTGACYGCAGAQMTLKGFVERELKKRLPAVKSVEATF